MKEWFKTLKRDPENSIKIKIAQSLSNQEDVIALSVADSDYETSDAIKEALLQRVNHGAFGYLKTPDNYEDIIKAWYQRRYQVSLKKEWIFPAPKVLNAIAMALMTFTHKGDGVIIQTPVYHVFKPLITDNELRIIENKLIYQDNTYSIDFKDLEEKMKQAKVLLLCQPHNPVGRNYNKTELDKIVNLAKKHDTLIISDEIHSDIMMANQEFYSLANYFDSHDQLIVIGAPSKTFNIAGLQIAQVIIGNQSLRKKLKAHFTKTHISYPNVLALAALEAAYTKSDDWVDAQNNHIYHNYQYLVKTLTTRYKGIKIAPLEATYLSWINIGFTNSDSKSLVKHLAKNGLVVSDGSSFANEPIPFIRLNLACSKEQLKEALNRFIKTIDTILNDYQKEGRYD